MRDSTDLRYVGVAGVPVLGDRQFFKSCEGLSVRETPRKYAFCQRAIIQDDLEKIFCRRRDERLEIF